MSEEPHVLEPAEEAELLSRVVWPSHEPIQFLRRKGGLREGYEKQYEQYHKPENVKLWRRLLGKRGMQRLHFFKGMGLKIERAEIDRTIELSRLMHAEGLRVSVYIGGTMHTDCFYKEVPEARGWECVAADGGPITYMGYQLWRHFPCINNPDYRAYIRRVIDVAIEEVQADEIFFDNQILRAEPRSCRCTVCMDLFHKFLFAKYPTSEARIDRYGMDDLSDVPPPHWSEAWPPGALREINEPGLQDWIDFRCQTVLEFFLHMKAYIVKKKPATSVGMNIKGIHSHNLCYNNGIDHGRWREAGFNCCDAGLYASVGPYKNLIAEFRAFKITHTMGLTQSSQGDPLDNALCLAMTKQLDIPGFGRRPTMRSTRTFGEIGRFIRRYDDELYGTRPIYADVAVLRSFPSMAYNCLNWCNGPVTAEQGLWEARIPFGIVFDQNLDDLAGHRVMLLVNQESLSRKNLGALKRFVEGGGGLVATDGTGTYDEYRRPRARNALSELFGLKLGKKEERVAAGKGRVAYLPALVPSVPYKDDFLRHPHGTHSEVARPKNWKALEAALRWAAGGRFSFEVAAPHGITCEFREGHTPRDRAVHVFNFLRKPVKKPIRVTMATERPDAWTLEVLSPSGQPKKPPALKKAKGAVAFTLAGVRDLYTVCVLRAK